jgi:PAS domain S-box-containing protein
VVDELAGVADAELGVVYACTHGDRTAFQCVAARGIDADGLPVVRPNVGLAGRAIAEGQIVVAGTSAGAIEVETPGGRIVARHEVHVPLTSGSETVGVLTLARVAGGPFAPADLELLVYLAGRAGVGVANALTLRTVGDQAALNRAVLDTAADSFLSIGADGVITAWNPAAGRLFGWSADDAIGARTDELLVPERSRPALGALLAGDERQAELDVLHRDGHEFPVEIATSPLERHGELTHNAFVRDISERRRADLYMGAQYAVTRVLSESATLAEARDGVIEALGRALGWQVGIAWLLDSEAEVLRPTTLWASDEVDASEFLEQTMSATLRRGEPLPGRVWETGEALWIDDLSREPAFSRAGAAMRAGLHASLSFPVISGSRFIGLAEFFSSEVERPDPELLTLLGTVGAQIGQFSERKRVELEADRLKDEFFALVSHELRTPLTSIIGYLELVLEDPADLSPDARRFLQVVERNTSRLHRLVGDLLFVAQVEAGRLSLDRERVGLAQTVTDSVEAARPRAEELDVSLRLRADAVGDCEGDPDRIGQMLDNLVSNALKFTPAGGAVDVYLTERGGRALIEVRDSGVGIPADEQPRLFQRFFRSSTATARAIPGVGLGLTISRAIVDAHGGSIDFESEEGRGTTFRVELPLERQPSTHHPSEKPREVVL